MSVGKKYELLVESTETKGRLDVVFLIASFFPKPTGATYSAFRLAKSLKMLGVDVTFVLTNPYDARERFQDYDGFATVYFDLQSPGKVRKTANLFHFTRFVIRNRSKFRIYHIHGGGHINVFLAWWLKMLGRQSILKVTSDGWDSPDGVETSKWGFMLKRLYRRIPAIIVMTSGQEIKLKNWGYQGRLEVIPNGVDVDAFSPSTSSEKSLFKAENQIPQQSFLLCYAGYLGLVKGTDLLFLTWSKLHEKYHNLFLFLVGDYVHLEANLEFVAKGIFNEAGAEMPPLHLDKIRYIGHTDLVSYYIRNCDLFIFPSRQEGFGTVLLEAMSCGVPCVTNDIKGVTRDIIPDEQYGKIVDARDIEEFMRCISQFIDDGEVRESVGTFARGRVVETFSSTKVAQRCYDFYKRILAVQ